MKSLIRISKQSWILLLTLIFIQCNQKPEPDPLPLSVKSSLNLLQNNPQFVMYINFKNMRRTEFWEKNISDSLLNAEKTFGSLLNTFKLATGASITDGIDELYYSNSWFGENAIILKGVLDKKKLNDYLLSDSIFSIATNSIGKTVYIKNDNGLYFYFRDDNTICASNYLKQLDAMMNASDTAEGGVLSNHKVYKAVENVIYKKDLWMVSTEKLFIRGILLNFIESNTGIELPDEDTSIAQIDSLPNESKAEENLRSIENLYKNIETVSFCSQMDKNLKLLIQSECIDDNSSRHLKSLLNGFLTVSKLNSIKSSNDNINRILENLKLNRYDNSVYIELDVDDENIKEMNKLNIIN